MQDSAIRKTLQLDASFNLRFDDLAVQIVGKMRVGLKELRPLEINSRRRVFHGTFIMPHLGTRRVTHL